MERKVSSSIPEVQEQYSQRLQASAGRVGPWAGSSCPVVSGEVGPSGVGESARPGVCKVGWRVGRGAGERGEERARVRDHPPWRVAPCSWSLILGLQCSDPRSCSETTMPAGPVPVAILLRPWAPPRPPWGCSLGISL